MDIVVLFILLAYIIYNKVRKDDKLFLIRLENSKLQDSSKELQNSVLLLQEELGQEREKNRLVLSQKKSSETRLGTIGEHLVPFLENCPYNPRDMHHLGNPLDFLVYDLDQGEIVFLEVKTGNSKASKRQKLIKNIIKSGRVYYAEMRINEKGVRHKKFDNSTAADSLGVQDDDIK